MVVEVMRGAVEDVVVMVAAVLVVTITWVTVAMVMRGNQIKVSRDSSDLETDQ